MKNIIFATVLAALISGCANDRPLPEFLEKKVVYRCWDHNLYIQYQEKGAIGIVQVMNRFGDAKRCKGSTNNWGPLMLNPKPSTLSEI